jgi:methyltransferase-like protein/ubiquinone/menaquinone biosynthesis C-methylase UbiE
MTSDFPYDIVPYQGNFQPQLYPDRMAAPARLLGMKPAAVENCRYLELGCGEGENLINSAFALPRSEFVGIDLSVRHIETANRAVEELGLKNVKFLNIDLMKMSREEHGQFDYIAAHGLFSWVPDFVRREILALYNQMLAPTGIGHLSFNALPGGYLRQMMRDMMLFHTQNEPLSLAREEKAAAILDFLRDGAQKNEYYQTILKNETDNIRNRKAGSVLHDELSEENQPFYFHEFVRLAAENDLQYLCDSEYFSLPLNIFPPPTREILESFGDDNICREQYADFLLCRRFRNTLLCRADVSLNRRVEPIKLSEFYVASTVTLVDEEAELETGKVVKFKAPNIASFEIDHPLSKIALAHLGGIWTDSIKFDDLMEFSRRRLENYGIIDNWENMVNITSQILLELYKNSAVELRTYRAEFARDVSEFPRLSLLARRQARRGNIVTTVNNNELELSSSFMRRLLLLLDGTRDRLDLQKELRKRIRVGEFSDFKEKNVLLSELPTLLEESLSKIAKAGLLTS